MQRIQGLASAWLIFTVSAFGSCSDKDSDDSGAGRRPDQTYFKLTIDGVACELDNIHYAREGTTIHLATWGKQDFPNLNINVHASGEDDFRGSYPYYMDLSKGTSIILYGIADGEGYESHYFECPDGVLAASPGSLKIENIERNGVDEYITGSFSVTVFRPIGVCLYTEVRTKTISGQFRLKRAK